LRLAGYLIALFAACWLSACASAPLRFKGEAATTLERVKREGGETLLPSEYRSMVEVYRQGEARLRADEQEEAEEFFQLALLKGELLQREVRELKARAQEAERVALAKQKAEEERRAQEEVSRQAQAKAEALAQAQKEAGEAVHKKAKPPREHLLVNSYTVSRGESLPFISSKAEVYGDRNLWPLIYRANRDQISDPRHIWPGQFLRIPRNLGREDIAEARRYAQERPLH